MASVLALWCSVAALAEPPSQQALALPGCGPAWAERLLAAAQQGQDEVVRSLLYWGTAAEARDCEGRTALLIAAQKGDRGVAQILLEAGADPDAKDPDGWTPLLQALRYWNSRALALELLARGANVDAPGSDGTTALMLAARQGDPRVVRLLLAHGAPVDARDAKGMTR
ncbi:ankyrin repeat domain-containing protein [uncultured Thiodictyon sp.]|uniref:ankyrin repeat domain-containing protein n=1 Tax=uncultured Thiodictyon sp. TaxID=1846217 RepID=UPI0025F31171|nr:ankyrin repeat domain-containing protein [uncultured Thiodictyon sp.]